MYYIDYLLDELHNMLSPKAFFHANRQVLLNIKSVKGIHADFIIQLNLTLHHAFDEEVLVSRDRAPEFKTWMGK